MSIRSGLQSLLNGSTKTSKDLLLATPVSWFISFVIVKCNLLNEVILKRSAKINNLYSVGFCFFFLPLGRRSVTIAAIRRYEDARKTEEKAMRNNSEPWIISFMGFFFFFSLGLTV